MKANQVIYLIFPFVLGFIAQQVMKIADTSYWFYVWLLCLASIFIFVKIILPSQDRKFEAISGIDFKGAFQDREKERKPFSYIAGFHMLVFFGLIILYFIN